MSPVSRSALRPLLSGINCRKARHRSVLALPSQHRELETGCRQAMIRSLSARHQAGTHRSPAKSRPCCCRYSGFDSLEEKPVPASPVRWPQGAKDFCLPCQKRTCLLTGCASSRPSNVSSAAHQPTSGRCLAPEDLHHCDFKWSSRAAATIWAFAWDEVASPLPRAPARDCEVGGPSELEPGRRGPAICVDARGWEFRNGVGR